MQAVPSPFFLLVGPRAGRLTLLSFGGLGATMPERCTYCRGTGKCPNDVVWKHVGRKSERRCDEKHCEFRVNARCGNHGKCPECMGKCWVG